MIQSIQKRGLKTGLLSQKNIEIVPVLAPRTTDQSVFNHLFLFTWSGPRRTSLAVSNGIDFSLAAEWCFIYLPYWRIEVDFSG
jgi:hypothetical protein|tara:strand:+ start:12 stop:260 length:249 start_codon:yes stop_codon:yes gene_type:complete